MYTSLNISGTIPSYKLFFNIILTLSDKDILIFFYQEFIKLPWWAALDESKGSTPDGRDVSSFKY